MLGAISHSSDGECRIWGPNMFAAEGDEWRKHRRIISPAFSSATFDSVWRNTARVFDEMALVEGWSEKLTVEIPAVNDLTFKAGATKCYLWIGSNLMSCQGRSDFDRHLRLREPIDLGLRQTEVCPRNIIRRGSDHHLKYPHCAAPLAQLELSSSNQKVRFVYPDDRKISSLTCYAWSDFTRWTAHIAQCSTTCTTS